MRECSTLYSCTGKGGIEEIEFAIVALGAGKQGRVADGRRAVRLEGFCSGDKWRFHLGPAGPRRLERCRMRQKHTAKTRIVAPNSGFAYIASRGNPRWKSSVDLRKVWSVAMGDEILGSLGVRVPLFYRRFARRALAPRCSSSGRGEWATPHAPGKCSKPSGSC